MHSALRVGIGDALHEKKKNRSEAAEGLKKQKRELEIYIHIPFCAKKCAYCDFLSGPAGKKEQEEYVNALLQEIRTFSGAEYYQVSSVFFGGGTPSILEHQWIGRILGLLRDRFAFQDNAEISIECNPGTADLQKLKAYRSYGINRISFGLQSADNHELQLLGRIHTWEQFVQTYLAAREAGFTNVNVDLMSSLPGQSVDSWKKTLQKVMALEPEHISAYSLIIEEGTPFYERYADDAERLAEGRQPKYLPTEEEEREMYQLTEELLEYGAGGKKDDAQETAECNRPIGPTAMHRYEISNYAKAGYECRHNIGYWTGVEYVGFGLGASSYLDAAAALDTIGSFAAKKAELDQENDAAFNRDAGRKVRIQNTQDMQQYLVADFSARETEVLSEKDQMAEFMFLGLRMMHGVSEAEFERRFGKKIDEVYGAVLKKQCEIGLLLREQGQIFLSKRGIDLSNAVMAEFLLD